MIAVGKIDLSVEAVQLIRVIREVKVLQLIRVISEVQKGKTLLKTL